MKTAPCRRWWIRAILFVFGTVIVADVSAAAFHWVDKPGRHLTLRFGDRFIARYMYRPIDDSSPEAREATYKPYLHVFSPDGRRLLTKGPGGLYSHHRGIFFGFNKITYGDGLTCDTWHCRGKAYQLHKAVVSKMADDRGAKLVATIHWHGARGEPLAGEQRTMEFAWRDDKLSIDFASRLTPLHVKKIHLDGDPQHAGVQFRASQQVAEATREQTYFLRTDGKGRPGETRNWSHKNAGDPLNKQCTSRPWNAMSFVVDDQRYTVLYIDHPDNPKPSRWSERDYGRFGSYFVADIAPGEPLEIRYRYVVKKGEMSVEDCRKLRGEFITEQLSTRWDGVRRRD